MVGAFGLRFGAAAMSREPRIDCFMSEGGLLWRCRLRTFDLKIDRQTGLWLASMRHSKDDDSSADVEHDYILSHDRRKKRIADYGDEEKNFGLKKYFMFAAVLLVLAVALFVDPRTRLLSVSWSGIALTQGSLEPNPGPYILYAAIVAVLGVWLQSLMSAFYTRRQVEREDGEKDDESRRFRLKGHIDLFFLLQRTQTALVNYFWSTNGKDRIKKIRHCEKHLTNHNIITCATRSEATRLAEIGIYLHVLSQFDKVQDERGIERLRQLHGKVSAEIGELCESITARYRDELINFGKGEILGLTQNAIRAAREEKMASDS